MSTTQDNDVILTVLEKCDEIVLLRHQLAEKLSSGWINIAKARYQKNTSILSVDDIRRDIDATGRVDNDGRLSFNSGNANHGLMIFSVLPNHYLRLSHKYFIEALEVIVKLSNCQQSITTSIADSCENSTENISNSDSDFKNDRILNITSINMANKSSLPSSLNQSASRDRIGIVSSTIPQFEDLSDSDDE